jgi:hypothetical protein
MIPTQYKARLSRHLSYPIGAEALTDGLVGAPHAESFTVSFRGKPTWPNARFQLALTQEHPYKVLVVEFQPAEAPGYSGSRFMVESRWYDEKWRVTVYPVARALRHLANRLLRERGLPLVAQWLRSSSHSGWVARHRRIELVFHPVEKSLSAQEVSGV